jgi:hypothetical protein
LHVSLEMNRRRFADRRALWDSDQEPMQADH